MWNILKVDQPFSSIYVLLYFLTVFFSYSSFSSLSGNCTFESVWTWEYSSIHWHWNGTFPVISCLLLFSLYVQFHLSPCPWWKNLLHIFMHFHWTALALWSSWFMTFSTAVARIKLYWCGPLHHSWKIDSWFMTDWLIPSINLKEMKR